VRLSAAVFRTIRTRGRPWIPGRSSLRPRDSLKRRPYPRIIMTGQLAWRTTLSETLPISARLIPPRPLDQLAGEHVHLA
jgi:hypothetical protein